MVTPLGVSLEDVFISLVSGDAEAEAKRLSENRAANALAAENNSEKDTEQPVKKKKYKKMQNGKLLQ